MRRIVSLLLVLGAATASAIDTRSHAIRVAILCGNAQETSRRDARTSNAVRSAIERELRDRGYDARLVDDGIEDVERGRGRQADYYVEVTGWADRSGAIGGVAVPVTPSVAASVDVVISRVVANLRVFDGRSLDVVYAADLARDRTAIAPGVAFGGRALWAYVALPLVEWAESRSAANGIGRQAAAEIDGALRR